MKIIFGGEAKSEEQSKRKQSTANNRIIQTSAPQSAKDDCIYASRQTTETPLQTGHSAFRREADWNIPTRRVSEGQSLAHTSG